MKFGFTMLEKTFTIISNYHWNALQKKSDRPILK